MTRTGIEHKASLYIKRILRDIPLICCGIVCRLFFFFNQNEV